MGNKITNEQVVSCYKYGKKVLAKKITQVAAKANIAEKTGMKDVSAQMYIQAFLKMMDGECYSRTINAYATKYFLKNIKKDYGNKEFYFAVSAVRKHVDSYQTIRGAPQHSVRKAVDELLEGLGIEEDYGEITNSFSFQVNKSLSDSSKERKSRLGNSKKKPIKIIVSISIYIRNPDVVAEVLHRAKGVCERCKNKAPFIRASNKTPYLEVHHVVELSKGGEDTIKNALALCPNCHRDCHFGV